MKPSFEHDLTVGEFGEQAVSNFYKSKGTMIYIPKFKDVNRIDEYLKHGFDMIVVGKDRMIKYTAEVKTKSSIWKRDGKHWIALDKSDWERMETMYNESGLDTLIWVAQHNPDKDTWYLYAAWYSTVRLGKTVENVIKQNECYTSNNIQIKTKTLILTEASLYLPVRLINKDCSLEFTKTLQSYDSTSVLFK